MEFAWFCKIQTKEMGIQLPGSHHLLSIPHISLILFDYMSWGTWSSIKKSGIMLLPNSLKKMLFISVIKIVHWCIWSAKIFVQKEILNIIFPVYLKLRFWTVVTVSELTLFLNWSYTEKNLLIFKQVIPVFSSFKTNPHISLATHNLSVN